VFWARRRSDLCSNRPNERNIASVGVSVPQRADSLRQSRQFSKNARGPHADKSPRPAAVNRPERPRAHWMPFTANRAFKKAPRLARRPKDMPLLHRRRPQDHRRRIGMWCTMPRHGPHPVSGGDAKRPETLDYAHRFSSAIPQPSSSQAALRACARRTGPNYFSAIPGRKPLIPERQIALAIIRFQGKATRTRLIGREPGYHGRRPRAVLQSAASRKTARMFETLAGRVDHPSRDYDRETSRPSPRASRKRRRISR